MMSGISPPDQSSISETTSQDDISIPNADHGGKTLSSQTNGHVLELDRHQGQVTLSTQIPQRSFTVPTPSSSVRESTPPLSVNRSNTVIEARSRTTQARERQTGLRNGFSNLQGFPEGHAEFGVRRRQTSNTEGSIPFEKSKAWDQKSILSLGRY